jgi:hypothetical protein
VADDCDGRDYEQYTGEAEKMVHGSTRLELGFVRRPSAPIEKDRNGAFLHDEIHGEANYSRESTGFEFCV